MSDTELRYWETPEYRDKYSDKDRQAMADKGHAMPDGSYPIGDLEDLGNAIHAVGRGNADHDAIRKHIIASAKRLNAADQIPDNWNADGSLKQANNRALTEPRKRREEARRRHRAVAVMPEVRFRATAMEIRASNDPDTLVLAGTPVVYNTPYSVIDFFGEFEERMAPGVASNVIGGDTRFLFNHGGMPLGRTTSRTLSLNDSASQLDCEVRMDAHIQLANDLYYAVQRGDVSQMSVGFICGMDEWNDDYTQRTVHLFSEMPDVSAVTYPASPTTGIQVATRMMMEMPVQSRARVRQFYIDMRAGKVMSGSNQSHLQNALDALHELATASGLDPHAGFVPEGSGEDSEIQDHQDATDMPRADMDEGESVSYADGSGVREDKSETEVRATMKASTLRLLVEAGRTAPDGDDD